MKRIAIVVTLAVTLSMGAYAQSACNPTYQSCAPPPCPPGFSDESALMGALAGLQMWFANATFEELAYLTFGGLFF